MGKRFQVLVAGIFLCYLVPNITGDPDNTYYDLLGVDRNANTRTIRKAFKKLALTEHPDKKLNDPEAEAKFVELNEAFEVLKDAELRERYNRLGREGLAEQRKGGNRHDHHDYRYFKEDFGLYDDDEQIETYEGFTFWEMHESDQVVMVNFYSTGCSHCHDLAPTWRELGIELRGVVKIAAVNCQESFDICHDMEIHSYPTLIRFGKAKQISIFNGQRILDVLVSFALETFEVPTALTAGAVQNIALSPDPVVLLVCVPSVVSCEPEVELRKISGLIGYRYERGLPRKLHMLNCNDEPNYCEKAGYDQPHVRIFHPEERLDGKARKGKMIFPAKSIDVEEWAAVYSAVGIAEAVEYEMPLPEEVTDDKFAAAIVGRKLAETVTGNISDLKWTSIYKDAACETNLENIERREFVEAVENLGTCQEICARKEWCKAVDFYSTTGWCNLYEQGCKTPQRKDSGATSYILRRGKGIHGWLIFFILGKFECDGCSEMRSVARLIPELLAYGISTRLVHCDVSPEACVGNSITSKSEIILFRSIGPATYHGKLDPDLLAAWARESTFTRVVSLEGAQFPAIISGSDKWIIDFFTPWCPPCNAMLPHFRKASVLSPQNVNFGSLDCVKYPQTCENFNIQAYPTTFLYNGTGELPVPHAFDGNTNDADDFVRFIVDVLDPALVELTSNNWNVEVENSKAMWLVDFSAGAWCGPCTQMMPRIREIAKRLKGVVKVGIVNCDVQKSLCQSQAIPEYPLLRRFATGDKKRESSWSDYPNGQRWPDQVISWLLQWLPNKVVTISADNFRAKVAQKSRTKTWFVAFSCPRWCGPCRNFQAAQKQIAFALREENVAIAHLDCDDHRPFCNEQNIVHYPTARVYLPGKETFVSTELFNADEIVQWLKSILPKRVADPKIVSTLQSFYAKHATEKKSLATLTGMALKYAGRESVLFEKLEKKYGAHPERSEL